MPVLAVRAAGLGPAPGPAPGPPPPQQPGVPVVTWIDPDGGVWDLADTGAAPGVFVTGLSGISGPPLSSAALALPSGRKIMQSILPQPQVLTLGLYAYAAGAGQAAFRGLVNRITRAFYTVRGGQPAPGTLTVQQDDGSSRQMACYTIAGLDQPDQSQPPLDSTAWVLTLQGEPFWSDTGPAAPVTFAAPVAGSGVPPMPPVLLGSGTALGSAVVDNTGDADAYPVWVITGPGKPTVTSDTAGRAWSLDVTLTAGDVWTVVTSPDGQASVTDQNGASQWAHLAAGIPRDLWPLLPGVNQLTVELASAGPGSQIEMTYTRQWLRA